MSSFLSILQVLQIYLTSRTNGQPEELFYQFNFDQSPPDSGWSLSTGEVSYSSFTNCPKSSICWKVDNSVRPIRTISTVGYHTIRIVIDAGNVVTGNRCELAWRSKQGSWARAYVLSGISTTTNIETIISNSYNNEPTFEIRLDADYDYCYYDNLRIYGIPYTNDPTTNPSKNPTNTPSRSPTIFTTINPTIHPTENPTNTPSRSPTIFPTINPTKYPSENPTQSPTNPTLNPSANPTVTPSINPSKNSSFNPTPSPILISYKILDVVTPTKSPTLFIVDETETTVVISEETRNDNVGIDFNIIILACVVVIGCSICVAAAIYVRQFKRKTRTLCTAADMIKRTVSVSQRSMDGTMVNITNVEMATMYSDQHEQNDDDVEGMYENKDIITPQTAHMEGDNSVDEMFADSETISYQNQTTISTPGFSSDMGNDVHDKGMNNMQFIKESKGQYITRDENSDADESSDNNQNIIGTLNTDVNTTQ